VGVRPEYLRVADEGLAGQVSIVENLGVTSLVTIECADGTLVGLTVPEHEEPEVGQALTVSAAPGRLLLYGEDGLLLGSR
jgi:multiple sugar transport system ATP-binding protein